MTSSVRVVEIETQSLGRGARCTITLNAAVVPATDHRDVTAGWAARLSGWITEVARLRAWDDESFQPDLEQAAYLRLVELDPSRLTEADEPWVKRQLGSAIKRAMVQELRHDCPAEVRAFPDDVSEEDVVLDAPCSVIDARLFRKNRQRRVSRKLPASRTR